MTTEAPHETPSQPVVVGREGRGSLRDKPVLGYVAMLGSSSTALSSLWDPTVSNNRVFYGESAVHNALNRLGHPVGYVRDMYGGAQGGAGQYHFGVSGSTLATHLTTGGLADRCLARCAEAAAASGRTVALIAQAGANDIGGADSAETVLARVEELILRVKAVRGVKLILLQVWPRLYAASGPDEAVILPKRLALNAGLVTLCAGYKVPLVMCGASGDDPGNPGYLRTTWADTTRPGHPAMPLGDELGGMLNDTLKEVFRMPPAVDLAKLVDQAINSNPRLTGPGGSSNPTGWSTGNATGTGGSAPSHTRSTVSYGDGSGRNWLRLVCNSNGGNGSVQLGMSVAATTGFAPGDLVEALCEIRFPEPAGFGVGGVWMMVNWTPTFLNVIGSQARFGHQVPPIDISYTDKRIVLRTMVSPIPSGVTGFSIQLNIHGSGVVDVGSPCILINRVSRDFS